MANQEHSRILRRGVTTWNQWRTECPEVQPDLSQADHSHAYLGGANLSGTNLSGSKFFGANLRLADLTRSEISGANLHGALGLTQQQINSASGDANTKVPQGIRRPADWVKR